MGKEESSRCASSLWRKKKKRKEERCVSMFRLLNAGRRQKLGRQGGHLYLNGRGKREKNVTAKGN